MGSAVGVIRHAAQLAAFSCFCACTFRDDVVVGADESGAQGGTSNPDPIGGEGGARAPGAAGAPAPPISKPPSETACGIGEQQLSGWVPPSDSAEIVGSGLGGELVNGSYRLAELVEHGSCSCFNANQPLAQTLFLDRGNGYVISDFKDGAHWAAQFSYTTHENLIEIDKYCEESGSPDAAQGLPFGPFETYTMSGTSLWLLSRSCHYSAEYALLPAPPAK